MMTQEGSTDLAPAVTMLAAQLADAKSEIAAAEEASRMESEYARSLERKVRETECRAVEAERERDSWAEYAKAQDGGSGEGPHDGERDPMVCLVESLRRQCREKDVRIGELTAANMANAANAEALNHELGEARSGGLKVELTGDDERFQEAMRDVRRNHQMDLATARALHAAVTGGEAIPENGITADGAVRWLVRNAGRRLGIYSPKGWSTDRAPVTAEDAERLRGRCRDAERRCTRAESRLARYRSLLQHHAPAVYEREAAVDSGAVPDPDSKDASWSAQLDQIIGELAEVRDERDQASRMVRRLTRTLEADQDRLRSLHTYITGRSIADWSGMSGQNITDEIRAEVFRVRETMQALREARDNARDMLETTERALAEAKGKPGYRATPTVQGTGAPLSVVSTPPSEGEDSILPRTGYAKAAEGFGPGPWTETASEYAAERIARDCPLPAYITAIAAGGGRRFRLFDHAPDGSEWASEYACSPETCLAEWHEARGTGGVQRIPPESEHQRILDDANHETFYFADGKEATVEGTEAALEGGEEGGEQEGGATRRYVVQGVISKTTGTLDGYLVSDTVQDKTFNSWLTSDHKDMTLEAAQKYAQDCADVLNGREGGDGGNGA